MFNRLEPAEVVFQDGKLHSSTYADMYFASDGPDETDRVFLHPANIVERWKDAHCFTIAELGFGTGLNFLVTANAFLRHAKANSRLRFLSCELHPLSRKVIERALHPWRMQFDFLDEYLETLPPPIPGWHRTHFVNDRIELTVFHGEAQLGVESILQHDQQGVDAWFLDGFAPRRNPRMWDPALLKSLACGTKVGGTITTFTASGDVRRALQSAGFEVTKVDGLAAKRHTTLATLRHSVFKPRENPSRVNVVGGGIAGSTVAHALAAKQIDVVLYEKSGTSGSGTSAIPAAIQHGRLSASDTVESLFRTHAYSYSTNALRRYSSVNKKGALHIPNSHMPWQRLNRVASIVGNAWMKPLDSRDVDERLQTDVRSDAMLFPKSAVVDVGNLCRELIDSPRISLQPNEFDSQVFGDEFVVFATGSEIPALPFCPPLELAFLEGQVDRFVFDGGAFIPSLILVHEGYLAPQGNVLTSGSTYEYQPWPSGKSTSVNRERIVKLLNRDGIEWVSSFRGKRTITSDRFPVAGKIATNTWLDLAHGSSGTTTAPFLAEQIACEIAGELPPGSMELTSITNPYRFTIRQQRRPDPFTRRTKVV